ncbi:MAG: EutN/CcmL family microcompartment protein [Verrucomicrobia bacterium]|nr:EutN/CcmL family microcompartment protein [Verrucomicrobiota bacterium]
MILARVDGVMVTTVCHPSMTGHRSIICQPLDENDREEGPPILAIDPQGAGLHERVLISTDGSHTREHVKDPKSPLRNIVMAIVDEKETR